MLLSIGGVSFNVFDFYPVSRGNDPIWLKAYKWVDRNQLVLVKDELIYDELMNDLLVSDKITSRLVLNMILQ